MLSSSSRRMTGGADSFRRNMRPRKTGLLGGASRKPPSIAAGDFSGVSSISSRGAPSGRRAFPRAFGGQGTSSRRGRHLVGPGADGDSSSAPEQVGLGLLRAVRASRARVPARVPRARVPARARAQGLAQGLGRARVPGRAHSGCGMSGVRGPGSNGGGPARGPGRWRTRLLPVPGSATSSRGVISALEFTALFDDGVETLVELRGRLEELVFQLEKRHANLHLRLDVIPVRGGWKGRRPERGGVKPAVSHAKR